MKRFPRALWVAALLAFCAGLFVPNNIAPDPVATLKRKPLLEVQAKLKLVQFKLSDPRALVAGVPWKAILYSPAGPLIAQGITGSSRSSTLAIWHVRAGLLAYKVIVDRWTFNGTIRRQPGLPITPLDLKVGARAARVVGNRPPALVLHPLDAQQNVSNEPIAVLALRPDQGQFKRTIGIKHLTAWTYIPTGLKTGILKISASSAAARGERAEVDVQPGPVVSGQLQARTRTVAADQREWWDLRLENARDALGNTALNGTVIEFNAQVKPGKAVLFATRPTVRATASLDLPPTVTPGQYNVQASSETFRSSLQPLDAIPPVMIQNAAIGWQRSSNRLRLHLGPFVDRLQALPDNGTPVELELLGAPSKCGRGSHLVPAQTLYAVTLPLQNGNLTWELPPLPTGSRCVRIRVAGQARIIAIPEWARS